MAIKITDELRQELEREGGHFARLVDPASRREYVVVPADVFERLQDQLDQASLRKASTRHLADRLKRDV